MRRPTQQGEPEQVRRLIREAFENEINAGCFLFISPAVSQATSCDGMTVTTTKDGQEVMPGTLPTF